MADQQTQIYEYTLSIVCIKMNVKFPCKMKLELNGTPLTSQVASNGSHKFIFNQEITLKEEGDKPYFELQVSLLTEKGGKYIAGILKMQNIELRSEGQAITIPLIKCLDNQAYCQLRMDQVTTSRIAKKASMKEFNINRRHTSKNEGEAQLSPSNIKVRKRLITENQQYIGGQTKSELHFPLTNRKPKQDWEDNKTKLNAVSIYNRNMIRSPSRLLGINPHGHIEQMSAVVDRDKLIQAEVYKEGYNKLKQKYKKQAEVAKNQLSKRIGLENSENNLKLEIMRLKLKNEEQQKSINEKSIKIKQLQGQISNFQKKQLDLVYLKQQYSNKDHNLKMLQESVRALTRDLEELRNNGNQRAFKDTQKIKQLKKQLQNLKQKSQSKQSELERQLKNKIQALRIKDSELQSKNDLLNREKKAVDDLERDAQAKLIQYQRTIQMERAASKSKSEDLKIRLDKSEKDRYHIEIQKNNIAQELQKTKTILLKIQYQNKILFQQTQSQKKQLAQMKQYKEKHGDLTRDLKMVTDDRSHLQKQLERAIQNKQINLNELSKQHLQQIEYFKKVNKQLDEKQRNLSNKILQLEGLIESSKATQQKLRRGQQTLNNQLSQAKQKEKSLKKALKTKQQQILALENDISTSKQKTKGDQHFLKHQIQQYKEQLERIRVQYEDQSMKNVKLTQTNAQLSVQLGKARVKLQFMEQKIQKDSTLLIERKQEIQILIRDHQTQIGSFNDAINLLRQTQKDLIIKIQKQEIEMLRTQDRLDRATKDGKILEQKLTSSQTTLKQKQTQNINILAIKNDLESRVSELQEEISLVKNDQSQLQAQKIKNMKVMQIIQEQVSKNKKQNEDLKHVIEDKQKNIENLQSEVKKNKQEITKLQMKVSTSTNEYIRFRQNIIQSLNSSFSPILTDAKKHLGAGFTIENTINRRNTQATTSQINNLIISFSRETKLAVNKLGEHAKQMQRENEKINDELTGCINKGQTNQYDLNKQIHDLEEQLTQSYSQRDQENHNFDVKLKELNGKIRERDREINDLNQQIQEANFSLNTMKLDFDAQSDQNSKKNTQVRRQAQQLQQKIQFLTVNIKNLEQKISGLETQKQTLLGQLRQEKQNSTKVSKNLFDAFQKNAQIQKLMQQAKRQRKEMLQKNSNLQIQLSNQCESHQKTKRLLEEEEMKGGQLKSFINSLMKQKQQIIKSELEKGEYIIKLQVIIQELTRERDELIEQGQRLKKISEDGKESNKKTSGNLKQIETRLSQQKIKNQKLVEKIRQKEKDIINKDQNIEKLQDKYNRLNQRILREGNQLREQIDSKTNQIIQITQQYSQKCYQYQKEKQSQQSNVASLQSQVLALREQVYNLKQNNDGHANSLQSLGSQVEQLRMRVNQLQIENEGMNEQLRQKQEIMYQMQGKLYNLEGRLESKQKQKIEKINVLDNDWICKYEGMCEQYEQRIELVEKERDYFKIRLQEQQEEFKKLLSDKNILEIDEGRLRSALEDKIKKLQEQRLQLATLKNGEIQKLSEQIKSQTDSMKSKEIQSRRVLHQLEVARSTITKLDVRAKQNEDKIKNLNKIYQAEIQQYKRKQNTYQNFKESVATMQWSAQRDVRRVLQGFIKRSLESCEDVKNSQKMMDIVRNLEQTVVDAMKFNLDDLI